MVNALRSPQLGGKMRSTHIWEAIGQDLSLKDGWAVGARAAVCQEKQGV